MVKVSVIGGGCLGVKIIGELAFHGHEVRVYDRNPELLDRVRLRVQEDKRLLAEDGVLQPSEFLGSIYYVCRLEEAVKGSEFIFEAVTEDLALKQDLFEWISQCCKADAIIATNSMYLSIDEIAQKATNKERCLGVRYLYPVYCIPEVEIVPGSHTSLSTLEKVRGFLGRMGKVAYFRSGNEPLILTDEQREKKKLDFLKNIQENKGCIPKVTQTIPNLIDKQLPSKGIDFNIEESTSGKDCVVCMDEERNCVMHPCHHMCTCIKCGRLLLKRQDACPICRKHISSIFRVYHS